jgi:hypothetical protein
MRVAWVMLSLLVLGWLMWAWRDYQRLLHRTDEYAKQWTEDDL